MATEGELQVWWVPQVPMEAFTLSVSTPLEGARLLDALAKYDLFQLEHGVKPDFCNAGGLNVFEDGEWCDWCDPDSGEDVDSLIANQAF